MVAEDNEKIVSYLRSLGLTKDAIRLYFYLLSNKQKTMVEASLHLNNYTSANYRLAYKLKELGLIHVTIGRPMRFAAYPLNTGLMASKNMQEKKLQKVIKSLNTNNTDSHLAEIIIGRKALYDRYEDLAKSAQEEILVYSIGIAYSESLFKTQKDAIKRGVSIRHIVQRLKSDNYHIINKWVHLGVRVRHSADAGGFHLMLFDRKQVLVTFSDPKDTDNRISILTDQSTAVKLFLAQFQTIWGQSKEVV